MWRCGHLRTKRGALRGVCPHGILVVRLWHSRKCNFPNRPQENLSIWLDCFISGMAEVIGVVSGAITFATIIAQVTESIITIKEYCSQCRDATDDLRYLIRDLELFELILAEMEQDISQKDLALALRGSQHVMQSLQFSREAATTLQAISDEIALKIQSSSRLRRSYAAAKIVMQRGKMERYMTRLRNAIQLLSLSQQCYTRFVMTQLLVIIGRLIY